MVDRGDRPGLSEPLGICNVDCALLAAKNLLHSSETRATLPVSQQTRELSVGALLPVRYRHSKAKSKRAFQK